MRRLRVWVWALCYLTASAAGAADTVDRITQQFPCGTSSEHTCAEINQAVYDEAQGLSVSHTEVVRGRTGEILFARHRLLVGKPSSPPQVVALQPTVPPANQPVVYRLTFFWRPQDSGSLPQTGNDPAGQSRFADAVHQEALKALRESRQFVATQRITIEQGTAIAQEWQSAAVGQSTAAVGRVMKQLAQFDDASPLAGEADLERAFQTARSDPLNVPQVLAEGAAVARLETTLATALASKAFFEAAAAAAQLDGATGISADGAASLASIGSAQGVLDFSGAQLAVPPSPLSSRQLTAYAATPEGRGLRVIANQYAAAWAEFEGAAQLDAGETLMFTAGLALVHQAAASGTAGDWRMRDAQLYLANGALDVVRGFAGGFAEGLADAVALIPELARGLTKAAELLTASPERQIEAAAALMRAIPEIPAAIQLAVSATYDKWTQGNDVQRAELLGRLASEVFIGAATGELMLYLRGLSGLQVVRTAPARGVLSRALAGLDAKEVGTALAASVRNDSPEAAAKLVSLLRDNPEAALALSRLADAGTPAVASSFIEGWNLIDASAIRFAADELLSRGTSFDADAVRAWAGRLDELRGKAAASGGLSGSAGERTVVRAIPRYTEVNGVRVELSPADAWEVSPNARSGRFKLRQEQGWSTAIVDPKLGKPAAWETAIAEYGENRAMDDFWLVERTVKPTKILTLDDVTLGRLGLTKADVKLMGSDSAYLDTHAIARLARELGFDAIEAPAAVSTTGDWNLHILDRVLLRKP